jgi:hypothetical protein
MWLPQLTLLLFVATTVLACSLVEPLEACREPARGQRD